MNNYFRLLSIILSTLALAAHFFRSGNVILMALSLGLPFFLFPKGQWGMRAMQVFLFLGGLEWIRTAMLLIMQRQAIGLPWLRMAFILGGVALFTFLAAFVSRRLQSI